MRNDPSQQLLYSSHELSFRRLAHRMCGGHQALKRRALEQHQETIIKSTCPPGQEWDVWARQVLRSIILCLLRDER